MKKTPLAALILALATSMTAAQTTEQLDTVNVGLMRDPGIIPYGGINVLLSGFMIYSGEAMPLDYAYFCLCLLAASSANPRTPWFFAALSVLALYALWPAAPKSGARPAWALAFAAAVGLAFAIQVGLLRGQANLEEMVFEWLAHRWNPPADPYRTRTAIGRQVAQRAGVVAGEKIGGRRVRRHSCSLRFVEKRQSTPAFTRRPAWTCSTTRRRT